MCYLIIYVPTGKPWFFLDLEANWIFHLRICTSGDWKNFPYASLGHFKHVSPPLTYTILVRGVIAPCRINLGFAALCHGARWVNIVGVTSFPGSCSFTRTPGYNLTCHKNDCKVCKDTLWDFNCITNLIPTYQDSILSVATLTHHTGTNLHGVSQRGKRVLLTESSLNISHFTNFAKTCGTWIHCLILSQSLGKSYAKRRPYLTLPSASPTLVHLLLSPLYLTYGMLTLWATHGKAHATQK